MNKRWVWVVLLALAVQCRGDAVPGPEEFGLTEMELKERVLRVEALIDDCMRRAGFEYVPVLYAAVPRENLDKRLPGLDPAGFAATYGYGISTAVDGEAQVMLSLGAQNARIIGNLSESERAAYRRALLGEHTEATFMLALEREDFSETGGCTRAAVAQVFSAEEMAPDYRNPGDTLMEEDPRLVAAYADWSACMQEAGFDYASPEEVEDDLEARLEAVLDGADIGELSAQAQVRLAALQGREQAAAVADLACEAEFVEPVIDEIETELYGQPQP